MDRRKVIELITEANSAGTCLFSACSEPGISLRTLKLGAVNLHLMAVESMAVKPVRALRIRVSISAQNAAFTGCCMPTGNCTAVVKRG